MGQSIRCCERHFERRFIRDPTPIEVRGREPLLGRQKLNLSRSPVHQHQTDVQGAQHRNIHQDVAEVLAGYDSPINADDERAFPVLWDVLEDAAQVGEFHFRSVVRFC